MSVRNLQYLFEPRSIALIGASKQPKSVGAVLAHNLFNAGFDGAVMPVNPHEESIESTLCYNAIGELPIAPDLAVVCTPPKTVPPLVAELGERGTKGVVIITAGFGEGETDPSGTLLQDTLNAARPHLLRIIGPNCVGIMAPHRGINASFVHINPKPGHIGFVSQSGAVTSAVVDWATHRGIGFSHLVSLGNMSDVDFGDMLDYLAADQETRSILLYIEAITDARKFMSAGRAAARAKPVIVVKSGRNEAAAKAAASHTGSLAGADEVYDAAFRRAGMLRVFDMTQLFDAVETLASGTRILGDRLVILTNGGGIGVLATEALIEEGGTMAELEPSTIERLNEILPRTWSRGNPVDIIGDAPGERYAGALQALLEDPGKDAVLVLNCPTAIADSVEAAEAVVAHVETPKTAPVLTSWLGEGAAVGARKRFATNRIPTYETPGQAARAFMHLVRYKRNQDLLLQTPPSVAEMFAPDTAAAAAVIHKALSAGRTLLTEPEAKEVLQAYEIPVVRTLTVGPDPEEAAKAAETFDGPVALKILSHDISHKADVGGVRLGLRSGDEVHWAASRMLALVAKLKPEATLQGFTVQEMADMPGALELIVGIAEDNVFGPILLFGAGGTKVEVVQDKAIALPPLNMVLAREMMSRTRVWRELQGYRHIKPADVDAVALTLVKLSQLLADLSEVSELDINPLLANDGGVLALDARIVVQPPLPPGSARTAIRARPKRLEKDVTLPDGRTFLLRPIMPEDEPLIQDLVANCSSEDIRLLFFSSLTKLSHEAAVRLTQIDYDREMALVAEGPADDREGKAIFGVVRIAADPDNERAEYAVLVRSDLKGKGLGFRLMTEIIAYARGRGTRHIFGEILRENTTMLKMCEELGFDREPHVDDPGLVLVTVDLTKDAGEPADRP